MTQTAFSSLTLRPALLKNLASLGYNDMTPIQAQSLPHILAGKDLIAQAKTGSGKTAAFGLGLLSELNVQKFFVQALILCPTRELADQVANELRRLARAIHNIKILTLCGGVPFEPQVSSLWHGAHIVVGTPGRIEEHLRKKNLKLNRLTTLVLDEADRMLAMGFRPTLDVILDHVPDERQTLWFSATFPESIKPLAERAMKDPVTVEVDSTHDSDSIKQRWYAVDDLERLDAVQLLLLHHQPESAVVFCNTKLETVDIANDLSRRGFDALALNGDLQQRERTQTLVRFSNKSISVLVATDVAARGLDIDALDLVINYHIARDSEVYVHRIGRTGRAGSQGIACSLYAPKEHFKLNRLEAYLGQPLEVEPLPPSSLLEKRPQRPRMATLQINGGKKQKLRPTDILGALTAQKDIEGSQVGKINIFHNYAYVAVHRDVIEVAVQKISDGKLKGRLFRARRV